MDDAGKIRSRQGFKPIHLDAVNLLLVDVNGAIKPYLNVYLFVHRGWNDGLVGLGGTVSGLVGLALQTPMGAVIDLIRDKRLVLLGALILVAVATLGIALTPHFWPVLVASCVLAAVGGVLSPVVAALTLGLFAPDALARRFGRNAAMDRAGNVVIAVVIGGLGWLLPDRSVFYLVPVLAVACAIALLSIPRDAVDVRRARGGKEGDDRSSARWRDLLKHRPLMVFAGCVMLFHFANAPLLTLVAQEIGHSRPQWSSLVVSVCIVGAQAVMVPVAIFVGRNADQWGRKPLLLLGFAALPLRALLYTIWHDPFWLIAVQFLDGLGAGMLSAVKPLVLADLMRGTGRYNLAHGFVGTLQGAGASMSFVVTGSLVHAAGFDAAYLACAASGVLALATLAFLMPESAEGHDRTTRGRLASFLPKAT